MTAAALQRKEGGGREFVFTDADFERVRAMLYERAGIALSDAKRQLAYSRLARRLRALGLRSFAEYLDLVDRGEGDEPTRFVNALTTNLTAFFREPHHFEHLAKVVVPELRETHARDRRIRIWSAACSVGEEPYSIAMTLRESWPDIDHWDVRILATDIDSDVVEKATRGVYAEERVANLEPARLRRWFLRGRGPQQGMVRVRPELQAMIRFRTLNLLEDWPMRGPFDVVFCRNVVIYFDKPTQARLFDRMADVMAPAAHLYIGHSESLFKVTDRFENLGRTIYRRIR